jgi:hypothetical protein
MYSVDLTTIKAALGDYCREHKKNIFAAILMGLFETVPGSANNVAGHSIANTMQVWPGITDETPLPQMELSSFLQPRQEGVNGPTNFKANVINFKSRMMKVRPWEGNIRLNWREFERTWLAMGKNAGTWKSGNVGTSDVFDGDILGFIVNKLIAKAHHDFRLKALYKGVYNAAGTGVADIMDGYLTVIANEIVAGNLTPVATGVITPANVNEKMLAVYDGLSEQYKASDSLQMLIAPAIYDMYVRNNPSLVQIQVARASAAGYAGQAAGVDDIHLLGTNVLLKREPGMVGSQRIICTQPENMYLGVDTTQEYTSIKTYEYFREDYLLLDGKAGVQFAQVEPSTKDIVCLSVNDQA